MTAKTLDRSNDSLLAETLGNLIEKNRGLTPTSLAKKLGIPTNKITRILNGDVTDPKASTLLQLAQCFDITVEQLLGLKPILRQEEYNDLTASQVIPVHSLSYLNTNDKPTEWYRWVENDLEGNYFGLIIDTDLYEPTFSKNSLLILNTDINPEDRSFIVVNKKSNPNYCLIKKYVIDGDTCYLYPINPKLSIEKYDNKLYSLIGVILEVHQKLSKNI